MLLTHHQKCLISADRVGDHVHDCLALACARRAFDHKTWHLSRSLNGLVLRWITCGHAKTLNLRRERDRLLRSQIGYPENGLKAGAHYWSAFQDPEILGNGLPRIHEMEEHGRTNQLAAARAHSRILTG